MTFRAKAIPTEYAGVQFRSRIEARWAAFFDIIGWQWEYEPIDLDGYIPDFILQFEKPLLVEVKPVLRWPCLVEDCRDPHCRKDDTVTAEVAKIRASGWGGEAILVGAAWRKSAAFGLPALGKLVLEALGNDDGLMTSGGEGLWPTPSDAVGFVCSNCQRASIHSDHQSYHCRASGCHDGDHYIGAPLDESLWRMAGNRVQWRRPG